ncbi:MAG TPA: TerC family protein [Candidatus Dormibacteraeota bacterium]|nr:TerC family protein [Verrucomicrobiae bacterium]HXJ72265.1 TerC family protein [Candidatus Dormibacteraeota bacterium]
MMALADTSSAVWAVFIFLILFFLALDLGVFHRRARVVRFAEALLWSGIWFACAMIFALVVAPAMVKTWSRDDTIKFITGYVIELSLSMDNVFVIALLFSYFAVPDELQHRVLFWGILGALVMRGVMIGLGVVVIEEFQWLLYAMGAFLLFSGVKMTFSDDDSVHPEKNIVIRLVRKLYPVSSSFDGQRFLTTLGGRRALTPLALVLVSVETTDLLFAIDSIPAIFGVTGNGFIIFTSNVFAILGLRSLYFVLAGAIGYFRYLKVGLSVVLIFIGVKMIMDPHDHPPRWFQAEIPTSVSLAIVAGIIAASIVISLAAARSHKK